MACYRCTVERRMTTVDKRPVHGPRRMTTVDKRPVHGPRHITTVDKRPVHGPPAWVPHGPAWALHGPRRMGPARLLTETSKPMS